MSTYEIDYSSGVTLEVGEDAGKVSSIVFSGDDYDQIQPGINIHVGMKVSGVVPALQAFGWNFREKSAPASSSSKKSSDK